MGGTIVAFGADPQEDYLWWQVQDRNEGIGKPESLKHGFHGYWSRRITEEHRLVYKIDDGEIRIAACRYHCGA